MTWQRFALPSSTPDPNINFPTVWNSCVEQGDSQEMEDWHGGF